MVMRLKIFILILGVFIFSGFFNTLVKAEVSVSASPELASLIEEGLTLNNDIQSLEAQVGALQDQVSVAGSLDDPKLGLGLLSVPTDTFSLSQEPMTQAQLFISQRIPWFGELNLKSKRVALNAVRQEAVLEAKKIELSTAIASAWYGLGYIAYSQDINFKMTEMMQQILRVAETKYSVGKGLQQDVLQAQVEATWLMDEKIMLDKNRRSLENKINELINRRQFIAVVPPNLPDYPDLTLDIKKLQEQAIQTNPWIAVKQAEIDMAEAGIDLAEKDYYPDMDFKVSYGYRDEDMTGRDLPDFLSGAVVINIPLWQTTKQSKNLSASIKGKEAALKSYQGLIKALSHRVDALAGEINSYQEKYNLVNDALILQADQWARSALSAYEVGKLEFNTMINAQIRLLRFELQKQQYLFEIYQKITELEKVLGGTIHQEILWGDNS
ncbi:MAG: TolC family protein [Desulfobacterales bacterium]|nr:TolC family protein [Desulfobacterales bacterium]